MRIFQEVPLPPTCYIPEVALWLAFGRVPQVLVKISDYGEDYSDSDPRTSRRALDEDARLIPFDAGFSSDELKHLEVEVNYDIYAETKRMLAFEAPDLVKPTGEETVRHIRKKYEVFGFLEMDVRVPSTETLDAVRDGVDWANRIEAQCEAAIDLARAEVFRALAMGRLQGKGWREKPGEASKSEKDAPLTNIPTPHWTLRNIDWENSELRHPTGGYYAVQVSTSEMMTTFPRPQCADHAKPVSRYPGCILIEDEGVGRRSIVPPRPQKGRPAKGDGLIRKAVVNVFKDKGRRGQLPEKAEALVQEIIEYVALAFGETIGRSTAQGYAKLLPENNAGN